MNQNISQIIFNQAFDCARSIPGMGSLKIQFNPYTITWEAEINFSNNVKYLAIDEEVSVALYKVIDIFNNRDKTKDVAYKCM